MLTSLLLKYPNAIIQKHCPSDLSFDKIWFTNGRQDEFIGINVSDVSLEEVELLNCLFTQVGSGQRHLNESLQAREWFDFLFDKGPVPSQAEKEFRIIQFILNERSDTQLMKEALLHLLPHDSILVQLDEQKGLIIEEKNSIILDEEQLESISHVIESDFYMSMTFLIGQFRRVDKDFIGSYQYEKQMFSYAESSHFSPYIQSVSTVLPSLLLKHLPGEWKEQIFGKISQVFEEDPELIHTVKAFLENQSNISQTAKKLFMHRNSVQYRIDKFIERTTIDIKSFQGGLLAYLALLNFESDNLPKK
jgi:DNA-binding PucR family transcriptional regulator